MLTPLQIVAGSSAEAMSPAAAAALSDGGAENPFPGLGPSRTDASVLTQI